MSRTRTSSASADAADWVGSLAAQVDLEGAADAIDEAGRLAETVAAQVDLEGAADAIDEAGRLAETVATWVTENPNELCGLGSTGVGWLARATVNAVTGDPELARVAFEEAEKAAVGVCDAVPMTSPAPLALP